MSEVKDTKTWRNTLQALLLPKDVDQAVEIIQEFSGVPPYIWTASRKNDPQRAAWLGAGADGFNLNCYDIVDNFGRSRGMAFR